MEYKDNVFTYLEWRGDLDIQKIPLNEVDALIFSELAYLNLEGVVPQVGEEDAITIREANKRYKKTNQKLMYYAQKEELFDVLAKSPRFAEMTLCNYISTTDIEAMHQFAAMHINLTPNQTFIAFRGTDSTVVGWREDFNMTYMMPVPAQQSAVDYVNQTAKEAFRKYYLGGHSKGGNLAIYSSVFCKSKLQKKLVGIYSFDGPGFNRKMINEPAYLEVKDRIFTYVPEESFIGMLMEHEEDYQVVKSEMTSFLQHEGFFWKVKGKSFELAEGLRTRSMNMSGTIQAWLERVSSQERKAVVDTLFSLFERAGLTDFSEFAELDAKTAGALLRAVATVPKEERELVGKLVKLFIEEYTKK